MFGFGLVKVTAVAVVFMAVASTGALAQDFLTPDEIDYIDQLDQNLLNFEEQILDDLGADGPKILFPDQIDDVYPTEGGFGVEYGFSGGDGLQVTDEIGFAD